MIVVVLSVISASYQGYYVPSGANEPTLQPGDHVLVHDGRSGIHRGDLIVFVSPAVGRLVIMRVIGVGGDKVSDLNGTVLVNGTPEHDTYLGRGVQTEGVTDLTVPSGSFYVLGDNRSDAADSRSYGPVPRSAVQGRLVLRYWPLGRIGGV